VSSFLSCWVQSWCCNSIQFLTEQGFWQVSDGHTAPCIGLNLGVRTYFSAEDTAVGRVAKRHRAGSPGTQIPMCQAEGCKADLSTAKHYHRRHKVCELHSKTPTVIAAGRTQRFCQQCSRYMPQQEESWISAQLSKDLSQTLTFIWFFLFLWLDSTC